MSTVDVKALRRANRQLAAALKRRHRQAAALTATLAELDRLRQVIRELSRPS